MDYVCGGEVGRVPAAIALPTGDQYASNQHQVTTVTPGLLARLAN
jgi:hypothetical protein